jgi:DNA-binding XRE family transcriptional regulator
MTSLTKVLRTEMRVAARGESKQAVEALRAELQAIRKSIAMLERRLLTGVSAGSVVGGGRRAGAAGKAPDGRRARFSPALMRKHREALGMSRKAYARLLGVSSLSVYLWEAGRTRPRRVTVLAWQDLRKKGARALRAIAGVAPPRRAAPKARKPRAAARRTAKVVKKRAPRGGAKKKVLRAGRKRRRRIAAKRMGRAKAA